jgi:maltooligosyltrehalose trehalohydrolase
MHDESASHFLRQLSDAVRRAGVALGRHAVLIAESDANDPRTVTGPDAGGFGLQAVWLDDFHHSLHAALTGERFGYYQDFGSLGCIAEALTHGFLYRGQYSPFRGRRHGAPVRARSDHFIGYLQNHDQVGNRACGERIGQLVGAAELLAGLAIVLTGPFVPMLFQGEEWSASTPFLYFTDHEDSRLAAAVSEGRRHEFPHLDAASVPDPQDRQTWLQSKLRWEEALISPHREIYEWARSLIALRHTRPSLHSPAIVDVSAAVDEERRQLLIKRSTTLLVVNLGKAETAALETTRTLLVSPAIEATPPGVVTLSDVASRRSLASLAGPGFVVYTSL